MTLSQLRAFLAVAETGSVHRAAERLFVTQPAISMAVNALERSLGVALTVRDGRGLRLTPAGERLAARARDALALLDGAVEAAVGGDAPERGSLRMGAVTTAAESVVPAYLALFRSAYPDARVHLEVGNRARVWDLLRHHEVELVVAGRPPASGPFAARARRDNALVLVAPPDRDRVPRADLGSETWLLREPGSGTRAAVEELFAELAIEPPTLTLGSNGAIRESVQAGLGVSVLSRDAVANQLERGALVEWRLPPFPIARPWHAVVRSDRPLSATAKLFIDLVLSDDGRSDPPFLPVRSGSRRGARTPTVRAASR